MQAGLFGAKTTKPALGIRLEKTIVRKFYAELDNCTKMAYNKKYRFKKPVRAEACFHGDPYIEGPMEFWRFGKPCAMPMEAALRICCKQILQGHCSSVACHFRPSWIGKQNFKAYGFACHALQEGI